SRCRDLAFCSTRGRRSINLRQIPRADEQQSQANTSKAASSHRTPKRRPRAKIGSPPPPNFTLRALQRHNAGIGNSAIDAANRLRQERPSGRKENRSKKRG